MIERLTGESGFSLVEVLVAMGLMILILGASLTSFNAFEKTNRTNQLQNDNQEQVRSAMDQMARELRNHAVSTPENPIGIDKATSYDLVFQTVNKTKPAGSQNVRNARRVRYCLDDSVAGNERLWRQVQTWTTAAAPPTPATASCPDPDPGWGERRIMADQIVNRINAQDRPAFIPNSAVRSDITRMRLEFFVDVNPGGGTGQPVDRPGESRLVSGVFFRNQNRAPVPAFTATPTGDGQVLLNASEALDPDNDRMTFIWCLNACDGSNELGRGLTYAYRPETSGTRTIALRVYDTAGLFGETTQEVAIP